MTSTFLHGFQNNLAQLFMSFKITAMIIAYATPLAAAYTSGVLGLRGSVFVAPASGMAQYRDPFSVRSSVWTSLNYLGQL